MMKALVWLVGGMFWIGVGIGTASEQEGRPTPRGVATAMTAESAREELQRLMDSSVYVASQQLLALGTFYPYGAVMEESGEIKLVGVPAEQDDKPTPTQTVKALRMALQQLAAKKRYRAIAIFVDFVAVRKDTGGKQAGIRIELEHRYPDHLAVFLPYYISPDGEISLLTPQYMPGSLQVLQGSSR